MGVDLSDVFKHLKMDSNIIDTTRAQEYLAKREKFSSDASFTYPETLTLDSYGNKVYCLPHDEIDYLYMHRAAPIREELLEVRLDGLKKLAEEIGKETDLICQLEYLIRKIPVRETKHSIHLIIQHLAYSAENKVIRDEKTILIQNDTPLLALGCLPQTFALYECPYLFATNDTAVICNLFTELCKKAGLDCVKLVIGETKTLIATTTSVQTFADLFDDMLPEVTGIITEKSDLDSAVDTFLQSEYHPFPLTRIFVQESIYKEFKDILAWKCKSQSSSLSLKSKCTDAFKYERIIFYLDYAGNVEETKNQKDQLVFVEAYRTTNELFSLLNKTQRSLCLSLWASGVSEANEIALKVTVPVIWINDYYNFNGPNKVSQAIFDKTYHCADNECEETIVKQLTQQQKAWVKQNFNERYEKVLNAFESVNTELGNVIKAKDISYWKYNDFVAVEDKTMILGFHLHIPIVSFYWNEFDIDSNVSNPKATSIWRSVFKALVNGSAFAYRIRSPKYDDVGVIFDNLVKCGLPVAQIKYTDSSNSKIKMVYSYLAESVHTKVIWTNFGTTFAN